jgi:hypothetical protein
LWPLWDDPLCCVMSVTSYLQASRCCQHLSLTVVRGNSPDGISLQRPLISLTTLVTAQHFCCDLNEDAGGGGEHGSICVAQLGGAAMLPTAVEIAFRPAFEDEITFEWNGAEIVDGHVARHGGDVAMTVGLAHGFIKHRSDDAAVCVPGRPLELSGQAYTAEDALLIIDEKLQVESGIIVVAATEAAVQRAVRKRLFARGGALVHVVSDHLR